MDYVNGSGHGCVAGQGKAVVYDIDVFSLPTQTDMSTATSWARL